MHEESSRAGPPGSGASIAALRSRLETALGRPVALVETHISWVLLDGEQAWKVKKPVRLGFLDFATLETRKRYCEEELRLNRRLAPGLYRDVIAIRARPQAPEIADANAGIDGAGAAIEGTGAVIDYALRMKQFAAGALFSERIAAGALHAEDVERFARRLAAFQRSAPVAAADCAYGSAERVRADALQVLDGIAALAPASPWLAPLRVRIEAESGRLHDAFERRRREGWIREGHGDLHLANVVVLDDDVTAFDCLEFDPGLRWIDVCNDAAFLAMDLLANDRRDLAFRFLDTWLAELGDYDGLVVVRYYLVYRALVRELVATIRRGQGRAPPGGARYAQLAGALIDASDPRLLITHGVSGSGKSFVSQRLLEQVGAIRIRSDVERKRLHGLDALQRSHSGLDHGLYAPDASARAYARLLDLAAISLDAGWPTIVDATFLRAADRQRFRALAAQRGVPFAILDCAADEHVLRERIDARLARGADASEADRRVLERQLAHREPLRDDERASAIVVDTSREALDVDAIARAWRGAPAA